MDSPGAVNIGGTCPHLSTVANSPKLWSTAQLVAQYSTALRRKKPWDAQHPNFSEKLVPTCLPVSVMHEMFRECLFLNFFFQSLDEAPLDCD
jgi:hypothetical protein